MLKALFCSVFILALVTSCGRNHIGNNGDDQVNQFQVPLEGKSFEEVMQLKYQSATYVCQLFVQRSSTINTSLSANAVSGWDLKRQGIFTQQVGFSMRADIPGYRVEVDVAISHQAIEPLLELDGLEAVDEEGESARLELKFTPVLEGRASFREYTINGGDNLVGQGSVPVDAIESIDDTLVQKTASGDQGVKIQLNCKLETTLYPAYQNQFKVLP